jgi:hypothetical protein
MLAAEEGLHFRLGIATLSLAQAPSSLPKPILLRLSPLGYGRSSFDVPRSENE